MRWRARLGATVIVLAVITTATVVLSSQGGPSAGPGHGDRPAGGRGSGFSTVSPGDHTPSAAEASPAAAAASPSADPSPTRPSPLLPNLRSQPAFDVRLEQAAAGRRLRFSAGLANVGDGPLYLRRIGRRSCPDGQLMAQQVIYGDRDDDGRYRRRPDGPRLRRQAGCMLDHPTHDHWHFDAMAAYALRRPGDTAPLVTRDKVSFCLRDNRRAPRSPGRVPKRYYGECTRDRGQGISPGWVDVYSYDLDGQWLPIPDAVSGEVLCLDLTADPQGLLVESDERDNGSSVPVRIGAEAEIVDSDDCTLTPDGPARRTGR